MRRILLILLAALSPIAAGAQPAPVSDRQQLPADVRREVADKWNRQNALRSSERLEIEAGQEVTGDVAVQRGPLVIAGHIVGSVLAIFVVKRVAPLNRSRSAGEPPIVRSAWSSERA